MKKWFHGELVYADCEDCNWQTKSPKNGQALAAKHAKYKNHRVHVTVEVVGVYDGRKQAPAPTVDGRLPSANDRGRGIF